MSRPVIAVERLGLAYGAEVVLEEVDLCVGAGERVALLGPSGSGKSSLLLALAGLVRPTSGRIEVAGCDLVASTPDQVAALRRSSIGLVFQFGELVPELSLLENVALPLRLSGTGRRPAEQQAGDLLADLGLARAARRRPAEVSGGQVQRAAIARALVHQPAVVLADEPTGALGAEHAAQVQALLFEQARARGAALVVATHAAELAAATDRTCRIVGRRLVEPSVAR